MDGHGRGDIGLLPAISAGTLFVFYMIWAAMHDIAHGEADCTAEWSALAASIPAFAFLYRAALRHLSHRAKTAWLAGTGLLMLLFDAGAISAKVNPKYPPDPMLGSMFLVAGVPVLGLLIYHLARQVFHRSANTS